jgi:DNA repair ATPase RecN
MAEVEYAGVKVSGGKLLIILPLIGSLGGALWGGFEVYKDYMDMKEQIQNYTAPDLSGMHEEIAVLNQKVNSLKDISQGHVEIIGVYGDKLEFMQNGIEANEAANRDMKSDMRDDIAHVEKIVDSVENDIQDIASDVRAMIDNAEERFENKRDALQNDYNQAAQDLRTDYDNRAERLNSNISRELQALERNLQTKLQRALDNPLAN